MMIIIVSIVLLKIGMDKKLLSVENGRKVLHFIAIMTCYFAIKYTESRTVLVYIFIFFGIVLTIVAYKHWLLPNERKSYGIAFFPFAFAILLATPLANDAILYGIITLGVCDPLAGFIGLRYGKQKIVFLSEPKSWIGCIAFFISSLCIGYYFVGWSSSVLLLAIIPALTELFSYRGSDNFTIPIIGSFWYFIITNHSIPESNWVLLCCILLIFIIVYKKKWLDITGVTASIFTAILLLFALDITYIVPYVVFFVLGSITSKLHPKSKDAHGRNAIQVLANSAVATFLAIAFAYTAYPIFKLAMLASICISFADTISSDIGIFFRQKTFDILTFKPISVGLSGGVSFTGTLAGILAALFYGIIMQLVFNISFYETTIITSIGIIGMFVDSILGSWLQVKYINQNVITEEKLSNPIISRGIPWIDNNAVNFITNVLVIFLLLILWLIKSVN
jgi:uncharacterized protein (TIGR00297 family)